MGSRESPKTLREILQDLNPPEESNFDKKTDSKDTNNVKNPPKYTCHYFSAPRFNFGSSNHKTRPDGFFKSESLPSGGGETKGAYYKTTLDSYTRSDTPGYIKSIAQTKYIRRDVPEGNNHPHYMELKGGPEGLDRTETQPDEADGATDGSEGFSYFCGMTESEKERVREWDLKGGK